MANLQGEMFGDRWKEKCAFLENIANISTFSPADLAAAPAPGAWASVRGVGGVLQSQLRRRGRGGAGGLASSARG